MVVLNEYITVLSLAPDQQARLRALIESDAEAHARWLTVQAEADAACQHDPYPLHAIHFEGRLPTDPRRIETEVGLADMNRIRALLHACYVTQSATYREALQRYLLAWSEVYQTDGNPINEDRLEPMFVSYAWLRSSLPPAIQARLDGWLRASAQAQKDTPFLKPSRTLNNWQAKRLKTIGLVGDAVQDEALVKIALDGAFKFVGEGLYADGSSRDFHDRDALHYHKSCLLGLIPLAYLAEQRGIDLYGYQAPSGASSGASIAKSVAFVVPYVDGTKTHLEWVNTTIEFDRKRAAAGLAFYQPGRIFEPREALRLLELSTHFEPALLPLVIRLYRATIMPDAERFPSWELVIAQAARR